MVYRLCPVPADIDFFFAGPGAPAQALVVMTAIQRRALSPSPREYTCPALSAQQVHQSKLLASASG